MSLIHIQNLSKHFKILNRREGLGGAFRDLFSGNYRTVEAVKDISFGIDAGEIVGYIGPNGAGKSTTVYVTGIPFEQDIPKIKNYSLNFLSHRAILLCFTYIIEF